MRRHLPLIANITVVWAVLFAVVHAYWAAGGSAGVHHPADSAGAQLYIAFVAMLGLAGAAVASARASHSPAHQRAAVPLARVAGAALLLGVLEREITARRPARQPFSANTPSSERKAATP